MNRFKVRFSLGILLALLLLALAGSVYSQEPGVHVGDKTVFGGSYVLPAGERLVGDLAVFGGTARIERDATVEGDVAIMGGSAVIDGRVTNDVAVFGGSLRLGESAVIEGDLAAFGAVDRAPGARVLGSEAAPGLRFAIPGFRPGVIPPVTVEPKGPGNLLLRFIWWMLRLAFTTAALGALGLLMALFLPRQTRNAAATAGNAPAASAGIGCLTLPAVLAVGIVLMITIIGIPFALILWLAVAAALLYGWVALGLFIGDRLLRMADVRSPRTAAAAAIGTALLTLVYSLFGIIPCLGAILGLVLGAWGLGAVVLSRGGTQRYPSGGSIGPIEPLIGPLDDEDFPPPPRPAAWPPTPRPARGSEALFADLTAPPGPPEEAGEEPRAEGPTPPAPQPPTASEPPAVAPPPEDQGNKRPS